MFLILSRRKAFEELTDDQKLQEKEYSCSNSTKVGKEAQREGQKGERGTNIPGYGVQTLLLK